MTETPVYLHAEGPVAHLVLNRPAKRNALNKAMWLGISDLIDRVATDPQLKVLVVRGADASAFAAGADIAEFDEVYATPESTEAYGTLMQAAIRKLARLEKASVAMIQGPCVGGGCGLALACDLRFADNAARFGITPSKLGLVYTLEDTKRLTDVVGPAVAKDILFTGRIFNTEEALRIGLVDRCFDAEVIGNETRAWANQVAEASQFSVRASKQMIRRILDGQVSEDAGSRRLFLDGFRGADFAEGTSAFMEKRKPHFPWK